jgi:hypothetical protein
MVSQADIDARQKTARNAVRSMLTLVGLGDVHDQNMLGYLGSAMTHVAHQELVHRRMCQPNQVTVWKLRPTVGASQRSTNSEENPSEDDISENEAAADQTITANEADDENQPTRGSEVPSAHSTCNEESSDEEELDDNGVAVDRAAVVNSAAIGHTQVPPNKTPS